MRIISRIRIGFRLGRKYYSTENEVHTFPSRNTTSKKTSQPAVPATMVKLHVVGSGAHGGSTCVHLYTDQTRYLFNCGECTQRLANEYKCKLVPMGHVFVTSNRWEVIGGLFGMGLTLRDFGVSSLTVHAPPGIDQLFAAMNRVVLLDSVNVKTVSCIENKVFEDSVMTVEYVPVLAKVNNPFDNSKSYLLADQESNGGGRKNAVYSDDMKTLSLRSEDHKSQYAICYICRPTKRLGVIMLNSIVDLGLPPRIVNQLKAGRSVKLPDGRIVTIDDVKAPDCAGAVFIIADCPTKLHIDSLVMNPVWAKHRKQDFQEGEENLVPKIIVHFTPEEILLDPRYVSWMESFPSTTEHLLVNDSCRSIGNQYSYSVQHKLNVIDEKIFPVLYSDCERKADSTDSSSEDVDDESFEKNDESHLKTADCVIPLHLQHIQAPIVLAESRLIYRIRPTNGFDYSKVLRLNPDKDRAVLLAMEDFAEIYQSVTASLDHMEKNTDHKEVPTILFLGTGSCAPSIGRNVSGILLQMTKHTRMLLDCGEGTYNQLLRFYGPHELVKVLTEINSIYISHLHADHHLGLISILKARKVAFQRLGRLPEPVFLLASHNLLPMLASYSNTLEYLKDTFQLLSTNSFTSNYEGSFSIKNKKKIFYSLGFHKIETVSVLHPANAYGVTLEHRDGWKITYSGDTMPCEALVKLGKDSDVCIHEATMEDELARDAKRKQHSTTSDAIAVGEKMNAKFILLTHFSQRYAKVPKIDRLAPNVGIAFDNMLVRLTDLPKLPLMYPLLKCMYSEEYEDMEKRTQRIKYREERMKTMSVSTSDSST